MVYLQMRQMKPDPSLMCNGLLAGLVAISAPCAFVDAWAAVLIGAVAGVLVVLSIFFWDRVHIDDPVGAISIHGVGGLWGLIALGLFANGKYGHGWNGVVRRGTGTLADSPASGSRRIGRVRLPDGLRLVQVQQPHHAAAGERGSGGSGPGSPRDGRHGLSRFHAARHGFATLVIMGLGT
jgi:hypothetical protein